MHARQNGSFGLTTLRTRHARVSRGRVCFEFVGKAGVRHSISLDDPRLARVVRRCQDLPGQELFQYVDDEGATQRVCSDEVNEYLREIAGMDVTAKDFRTWAGTVLAVRAMRALGPRTRVSDRKQAIVQAIDAVASVLRNTRAVCRNSYVHPVVIDAYLDQRLFTEPALRVASDEGAVMRLIEDALARATRLPHVARSRSARRRVPLPSRPAPRRSSAAAA